MIHTLDKLEDSQVISRGQKFSAMMTILGRTFSSGKHNGAPRILLNMSILTSCIDLPVKAEYAGITVLLIQSWPGSRKALLPNMGVTGLEMQSGHEPSL